MAEPGGHERGRLRHLPGLLRLGKNGIHEGPALESVPGLSEGIGEARDISLPNPEQMAMSRPLSTSSLDEPIRPTRWLATPVEVSRVASSRALRSLDAPCEASERVSTRLATESKSRASTSRAAAAAMAEENERPTSFVKPPRLRVSNRPAYQAGR